MDVKTLLNALTDQLPKKPRSLDAGSDPGFWTNGAVILCPSEATCEVLAEFLRDLVSGTNITVLTGWYTPFEDIENSEGNYSLGFNFICFGEENRL